MADKKYLPKSDHKKLQLESLAAQIEAEHGVSRSLARKIAREALKTSRRPRR